MAGSVMPSHAETPDAEMEERKKRRPLPLGEPVHKTVKPALVRRETAR
ncbi:hypothetical protein [Collinsella intestinalis]|nr:hypothetical protein [Collinsella intestinalis]